MSVVAAVQFEPKLLQCDKNVATAAQLAFEAAGKGARIIVLPELCVSGYTIDNVNEAMQCAQIADGHWTDEFKPIAKRFNCHIVFGYIELKDAKLYNSAAIVGPSGLVGNAQKHNLWGRDNIWAQPSEALSPNVVTDVGRLGVLICRDAMNNYRDSYRFFNPSHRFYRRGSIDVIGLVTNWGQGYAYPDSSWVELVESTGANVIVANRVGEERDMRFKGGSCVITRQRHIYTNGSSFTDEAVVGGLIQ